MEESSFSPEERSILEDSTIHVRRALEGDSNSLDWIVSRYTPLLRAQARYRLGSFANGRIDIEDVVAEAWLVALRKSDELEPRMGRMTPVLLKFLGSTVHNIARREVARVVREDARSVGAAGEVVQEVDGDLTGVITSSTRRELARSIEEAIDQLAEKDREVLILRGIEGMSNGDAAQELGEPQNRVAQRYRRALERLRAIVPELIVYLDAK